ncbi:MAG: ArsR family transcriptional regulator [Burkholderiales bacterium]|nr:ArsR family transcriptional regulator [Burkholderiales bacterium]OJX04976.1 MAG: ArsR family transcriptional regulator [Burkholderiales bacterium 70-64]
MNGSNHPSAGAGFAAQADVAKALGHPHRLALLQQIALGESSVERLAELSGLSVANASQHLQHLKRAGCVLARRDGKHVFYRLSSVPMADVLVALGNYVGYRQAQISEVLVQSRQQPEGMESVSIRDLLGRIEDGTVVLLDVRQDDEFAQDHLPGAVNIPLEQLERRVDELSENADIVAYCKGQYCVLTMEAVNILRASGRRARPLAGGVSEWRAAGLMSAKDL